MQDNPKILRSLFFPLKSGDKTAGSGKKELLKSAALVFVLLKIVVLLVVAVIVVAGLFGGKHGGTNNVGFLSNDVVGTVTYKEALNLILLGFLSGVVGGMLGMGGGVLKVVNLHFFMAFDIVFARVVSLLSYSVISLSAYLRYRKYDLIIWDVVKLLIPSSILGVLLGVIIGSWINKEFVEIILGLYALFAGIVVLNQILVKTTEKEITDKSINEINESTVSGIGVGMGFLCSLIGISGGVLSTPLQHTVLKLPLKNSIANSITAAVFCSITASTILLIFGLKNGEYVFTDVLCVTVCLIPGNILGGQFGSYLTKRLQINYVRGAFSVVAFPIGFKILVR